MQLYVLVRQSVNTHGHQDCGDSEDAALSCAHAEPGLCFEDFVFLFLKLRHSGCIAVDAESRECGRA
jgi:hypothetical protein